MMSVLGRRVLVLILVFVAASVLCLKGIHGAEDQAAQEAASRKAYTDRILLTYNFPFAKTRSSLPGNAAVEGGDFIPASAFPDAAYCGHCHQEAYHEWRQALHSNSFRTPFYRTSVNILIRTKGIEFARHCDSCHNPIAVLSGALNPGSPLDRSFDRDGVTCTICHSIQSVADEAGQRQLRHGRARRHGRRTGQPHPRHRARRRDPRPSRPPLQGRDAGHSTRRPSSAPPATRPTCPRHSTTTSGFAPSPPTTSGRTPSSRSTIRSPSTPPTSPPARAAT